jgi:hypothetical protein
LEVLGFSRSLWDFLRVSSRLLVALGVLSLCDYLEVSRMICRALRFPKMVLEVLGRCRSLLVALGATRKLWEALGDTGIL